MKKLLIAILLVAIPVLGHQSGGSYDKNPFLKNDMFPGGYSLLPMRLPPLSGMYMSKGGEEKLNTTKKQHKVLEKRFLFMYENFQKVANEIRDLETEVMEQVVYQGFSYEELKEELDLISSKKRFLTQIQIECINIFKKTLTKQQYKKILTMTKESCKLEGQKEKVCK